MRALAILAATLLASLPLDVHAEELVRDVAPPQQAQIRVFVASDSTAQDYPPDRYPQAGWATMLRCAFGPEVSVENRAIAARSTRTFIEEGRLDEIARDLRAGDTLLIQFGHNDANAAKPERYASIPDYKANLRRFLAVATNAGAQPVLLTPVTRRNFIDEHVVPSFPDYSQAVRDVAQSTGTPLIDLDALSGRWVEAAGIEGSKRFFLHYAAGGGAPGFPNGADDDTHFSELGARGVAELVAIALRGLPIPVAPHVLADRPALAVTEPTGGSGCAGPVPWAARAFRLAGAARPSETRVAPRQAYDGRFGFEADSRLFSVAVPEGNYRVTMTLGDARAASATTVKAEQRRLMFEDARQPAGKIDTRSFVVNVRTPQLVPPPPNAPGAIAVALNQREQGSYSWDGKLTLELLGAAPHVAAIEIALAPVPTVFLFGDSTVTDQRYEPWASWGQMLPALFGPDVAVANYAEAGETLKSFFAERRLDKALSQMKPGDFALIQFGHNDQKFAWPQTYAAAATTYRAYLRAYVAEIRMRGGTPVLVTPPERRTFTTTGAIRPTLADYVAAMRIVAAEEKVQVIDLNTMSVLIYEALGPDRAPLAFAAGGRDTTHHDNYGAWLMARAVAAGIRASGPPALAALLAPGPVFDPSHPPPLEAFHLAESGAREPPVQ
ncbi:MAG: rhamnogalacturonan acetylesterase [Croceibacterium sp.]